MKKMPIGAAEALERTLPEFVDLVQGSTGPALRLRLDDFENDPTLLYNCVWYAISYGRKVEIEATP